MNQYRFLFIYFFIFVENRTWCKLPFQIPIFEKGYEKDPAVVAKEAIQEASRNNSDVVLVDTAGRMQVINNLDVFVNCNNDLQEFLFQLLNIRNWPTCIDEQQDNEPLMRALSKLINLNNPDLVLFVGEALVGNDAVDQLSKFNQVRNRFVFVLSIIK